MKVIDLLNKIANGEVRHDIKINTRNYYCSIEEYLKKFGINEDTLNVEVIGFDDIIEEDKKIENIGTIYFNETPTEAILHRKIEEIIDYINEEKNNV